jgi:hypothetical protein
MTPISARSRKPIGEPTGMASRTARAFGGEHRRLAFGDHVFRAAHRMRGIDLEDVAGHEPVEQHPQRREVLLDRRRGERTLQLLDEGGDVKGLHLGELVEACGLPPLGKAARGVQVGFARVVVVKLRGEEFQHAARGLRRRGEQPGGKQAGGRGDDELAGRGGGHGISGLVPSVL